MMVHHNKWVLYWPCVTKVLKDIIVKFEGLADYDAPYIAGIVMVCQFVTIERAW